MLGLATSTNDLCTNLCRFAVAEFRDTRLQHRRGSNRNGSPPCADDFCKYLCLESLRTSAARNYYGAMQAWNFVNLRRESEDKDTKFDGADFCTFILNFSGYSYSSSIDDLENRITCEKLYCLIEPSIFGNPLRKEISILEYSIIESY